MRGFSGGNHCVASLWCSRYAKRHARSDPDAEVALTRRVSTARNPVRISALAPAASQRLWGWRVVASLVLWLLWSLPPSEAEAARRQLTVQEQYELGLKQMKRGYYVKALEQFNRIRNYHRDDPLAVKAELAIADVYFQKHEWDQARDAYEDFLRWHPRYPDADYVIYQLGMAMYKKSNRIAARDQTWTTRAADTWSGFSGRFGESEYLPEVDEKLQECRERLGRKELIIARFYRRRKAWVSVEGRAAGILANHATTDAVSEGMGLLAEARAWQGETTEADNLLDKLEQIDAREASRARRRVEKAKPSSEGAGT